MKHVLVNRGCLAFWLVALSAFAQTAKDIRGPAPVIAVANEAAPRIVVDPPLAAPLALGRVVIQYRAENLRIIPVFGAAALDISPRIGHIHVTVDDAPWRWADASGEPIILNGFPAGRHKVMIELVNPNHQVLDNAIVTFGSRTAPNLAVIVRRIIMAPVTPECHISQTKEDPDVMVSRCVDASPFKWRAPRICYYDGSSQRPVSPLPCSYRNRPRGSGTPSHQ